jgi:hypothetical protein
MILMYRTYSGLTTVADTTVLRGAEVVLEEVLRSFNAAKAAPKLHELLSALAHSLVVPDYIREVRIQLVLSDLTGQSLIGYVG